MAHRITLPLRPRPPYAAASLDVHYCPRNQPPQSLSPLSDNSKSKSNGNSNSNIKSNVIQSIPNSSGRSRALSISRPYSPISGNGLKSLGVSDLENDKENLKLRCSTDLSPIGSEDEEEEEDRESFERSNPRTWSVEKSCSFLRQGTLLPVTKREVSRNRWYRDVNSTPRNNGAYYKEDDASILRTLTAAPPPLRSQTLTPDCDQFLKMIDERLQLDSQRPLPGAVTGHCSPHVRSASSSYPSQGNASSPRAQSPESVLRTNKLSLTDLSRFSRANDRLSNLRSSSSLSGLHDVSHREEDHDVLQESSSAIAQWQKELRPRPSSYLRYELSESAEVLPSDSLSQQIPSSSQTSPSRAAESPGLTWQGLHAIRAQFDGVHDTHIPPSTPERNSPPPYTTPPYAQHMPNKQSKRKASHFSLRSLSNLSFTKRPRLGLRRWANNMYQHGSNRLRLARQRFREQAELDRRAFEAWRTRRGHDHGRRYSQASPSKPPKSSVSLPERKSDDWWKEGVLRFEAPKWMFFRGTNDHGVSRNY